MGTKQSIGNHVYDSIICPLCDTGRAEKIRKWERPIQNIIIFIPCKHKCCELCYDEHNRLYGKNIICPVCTKKINDCIKLY